MTLFWQNLLKTVCFGQNGFSLGRAGKNRRFCQNSSTCRGFVIVIFRFFGQICLKLELRTFAVHKKKKKTAEAAQNCLFSPKCLYFGKS